MLCKIGGQILGSSAYFELSTDLRHKEEVSVFRWRAGAGQTGGSHHGPT